MKILRKRVGSLQIDDSDFEKLKIINDSVFLDEKIIFNFLPIKNLNFFTLNLEKSTIKSKVWIYLDLNLNLLYNDIINGKIITSRNLIFELIISSLNKLKILEPKVNIKIKSFKSFDELQNNNEYKLESIYCFEKSFVKYYKIYFDLNKKLMTIDKCKKKRLKIPSILLINNYYQLTELILKLNIADSNSLFIISKKDSNLIRSNLFKYFDNKLPTIINSEDLNFQMNNYSNEISSDEFLTQLEFESNNFFYSKKNIFILTSELNNLSLKYLSFCNFEKIITFDFINKNNSIIKELIFNFDKYRISKNDNDNNIILSEFIFKNKIFHICNEYNIKYFNIQLDNFPITNWYQISNKHFLSLSKNNLLVSKFLKIGINNEWSNSYMENLKSSIQIDNKNCPISMMPLNSLSVVTECTHYFNLDSLLKWMEENTECPICRNILNINEIKFINEPSFLNLIDYVENNNVIIIADKLWFQNLKKSKNIILQEELIQKDNLKKLNKNNLKILNLSSLTHFDLYKLINEFTTTNNIIFATINDNNI